MSLFQNYTGDLIAAATRTAEQQKMFERCMGTMHLWYGNAHIHIWMMSVVPSYATRKYDERGWCKFEKRVGGIIKPSHMALDLGLMKDDLSVYRKETWFLTDDSFATCCSASRGLPFVPEEFDDEINKLQFSRESDRGVIAGLYRQTFDGVIAGAVDLNWMDLGWNFPLRKVVPLVLMATRTLEKLYLGENQLTGAIPRELGQLTQLTYLRLNENQLERPPGCPGGSLFYNSAEKVAAFLRCLS